MKKRIVAFLMVLVLIVGVLPNLNMAKAEGDIKVEDVEKSIKVVIDAVDKLKDIMKPEEASVISDIFNGFVGALGTVGSVVGPINGTVAFLKLVGLMKDGTAEALANITAQLTQINEKISRMDTKLDMITEKMKVMQATQEFDARTIKATQMLAAWSSFETNYMEDKMDELLRLYNVMLMDGLKEWVEYKSEGVRHKGNTDTDKVIIWYKCTNAPKDQWDIGPRELEYELQTTDANQFSWSKRTDVEYPDPYTIYSDEYSSAADRYVILDNTFFPQKGEMAWNVNTFRDNLKKYIKNKISDYIAAGDFSHFQTWNFYELNEYGDPSTRTPELIDEIAEIALNQIIFRICSVELNESADFATRALNYFKEYCNHLGKSQQGFDAMLKSLYLTHAFEFEVAEDIESFMNEMALKTGVYGLFVANVLGMSKSISDTDKEAAMEHMCSALDGIAESHDKALTGNGAYCYITGSELRYGEVAFTSSASVDWRHRGMYYAYRSSSVSGIKSTFTYDGKDDSGSAALIGDSNAVLLSFVLSSNGITLDHDYMNTNLTKTQRKNYGDFLTSLNGEGQITDSDDIRLKARNIIGDYFSGDPEFYMNRLPDDDAGLGYFEHRRMITGTLYDGKSIKLSVNKPLHGIGVYGESHSYWVEDESAIVGGPCNNNTFTYSINKRKTDSDIIGNTYYTTDYNQSTTYNCLMSIPVVQEGLFGASDDERDPLLDLKKYLEEDAVEHVHRWDEGETVNGVTTFTCKLDPSHTYTALYSGAELITLTFDPMGGTINGKSEPFTMEFAKGSRILLPQKPEKKGYSFLYWGSEEHPADGEYTVNEAETFTAVWKYTGNRKILITAISVCAAILAAAAAIFLIIRRKKRKKAAGSPIDQN